MDAPGHSPSQGLCDAVGQLKDSLEAPEGLAEVLVNGLPAAVCAHCTIDVDHHDCRILQGIRAGAVMVSHTPASLSAKIVQAHAPIASWQLSCKLE